MVFSPLVCIIIPVFGAERYLCQCLDSVIAQTDPDIEILLVQDGSADGSAEICDFYAAADKRITVFHKENGGPSSSRKVGVQGVSGQYVMFVDGDDWLDCDTVEKCINAIRQNPAIDCVLFSYAKETSLATIPMHIMNETATFCGESARDRIHRRIFGLTNDELNHPERMENIVSCCMKMYRADLARCGKYFDTKEIGTCEDGLFNVFALAGCDCAAYLDETLYHYRKHEGSFVLTYKPNLVAQWDRLFSIMQDYIDEYKPGARYQEALNNRIALSITAIALNKLGDKSTSAIGKIRYIRNYICSERYRNAVKKMKIGRLPLVWRMLLLCSRLKLAVAVFLGLSLVNKILKY